jgi:hypothetical protein
MTSTITAVNSTERARHPSSTTSRSSSPWVGLGLVAGPLFLVASLIQALLRPGFNLLHNAASLLSLGHFGWVQDLNFAAAGVLSLCGAIGMRRAMVGSLGSLWIPRLLGIVGVGLGAAAIFHPDPSDGFPPGTSLHASAVSNWHGVLHMVCGSAAFLSLIAACFVFGRHFSRSGDPRWATFSRAAGILFALALAMSGGHDGSLVLFIGVSIGWLTVTTSMLHVVRSQRTAGPITHSTLDA